MIKVSSQLRARRARVAFLASVAVVVAGTLSTAAAGSASRHNRPTSVAAGFGSIVVGKSSAVHSSIIPLATTFGLQRSQITTYLNSGAVVFSPVSSGPVTILSADQVKSIVVGAVADVPDATVLAMRLDTISLAHGTDFALSGDCSGADGATTSTCTLSATFSPTRGGTRTDEVNIALTTTQGFDAVLTALAGRLSSQFGISGSLATFVLSVISSDIHHQVDVAIAESYNPVATLSGVGVPVLSIDPSTTVNEGNSGGRVIAIPVRLNAATTNDVHFSFATSDGTATTLGHDYVAIKGSGVIKAGLTSAAATVVILGDTVVEANAYLLVKITAPTNAVMGPATTSRVNILNDDLPGAIVVGSSVPEGAPAYFSVSLTQPYNKDLTIHVRLQAATASSADYGALSASSLVFAAGTTGPQFVWATTKLDGIVEGDESFVLVASGANAPNGVTSVIRANRS